MHHRIKQTHIFLIIFLVSGLLYSCSKSPKCWGNNKNKGIIESSIRITCEPATNQQNFIIEGDSTYQQVFTSSINLELNCPLPSIDFNTYTLLGLYATGGCEVKYIRDVSQNDSEQKYHYKVTVKSCGACKREIYSHNWVSVPKLPEGWSVSFEIENK
jgi:hypothetical protein